ncbi:hypothetical protein Q765_03675 [Flavobacterium rivuli WB 3.3-2 = DSM 21788]|uniref:Uncharacterized protein n=1 Tax=Flavobacterium rivuli WB 3.3-2 = DSM 21788 TaxID=1121895 RepID=A0A0A2M7D1_9FLAO|nr:hypothetical protein Q765_03675 [Flavobacterium rivuli WB 3.3-2 = DSM 21788]
MFKLGNANCLKGYNTICSLIINSLQILQMIIFMGALLPVRLLLKIANLWHGHVFLKLVLKINLLKF